MGSVNNIRGVKPGYGPLPSHGTSVLSTLSRARRDVLEILIGQPEPCTVGHIATALHQHHNTVREHLDGLRHLGMVDRVSAPAKGRGRPPWLYRATPAAMTDRGASDYSGLAAALAGQLARSTGDPVAEAVAAGRIWGEQLAHDSGTDTDKPVVSQVLTLLDDLGYEPRTEDGDTNVTLHRCPLLAAANLHPEIVCSVHQGLVEGALAAHGTHDIVAEIIPFAEPGACRLRLHPGDRADE